MMLNQSQLKNEMIAGLTTFLTMAYIIVLNPTILSTPGTGMSFSGVKTATVLLAFSMTLLMGLFAKLPIAVAPGMGINAFFTYSLVLGQNIPWQIALGMTFWSGGLFLILSVSPIRSQIVRLVPGSIKLGMTIGIGLFLFLIGLKNGQFIEPHPVTMMKMAPLTMNSGLSFFGLLILFVAYLWRPMFAPLISIISITLISILLKNTTMPESFISAPDFGSVFLKLDLIQSLNFIYLPSILTLMMTDLFDSLSTFVGVCEQARLIDENGQPKNLYRGLIVDSLATLSAGLLGTSAGTAYIESMSGVSVGGRTGLTAMMTAFCFLPFLFLAPIMSIIPLSATAPVLIFVGLLMLKNLEKVNWQKTIDWAPTIVGMLMIPFTFSMTIGFVSSVSVYLILKLFERLSNQQRQFKIF